MPDPLTQDLPDTAPGEITVTGSRKGKGYVPPDLGPPIAYPHIPRSQYGKRPPAADKAHPAAYRPPTSGANDG